MTRGSLRGRLLFPSLTAVAWACACGGTSVGEGTSAGAGGDAEVGGKYGSQSGAPADSMPAGGVVHLPEDCPKSQPTEGSGCGVVVTVINYCKYSYSASCVQPTIATCGPDGAWSLTIPDAECGGAGGAAAAPPCPSTLPPYGTPCYLPGTIASYDCHFPIGCGDVVETCNGVWLDYPTAECAGAGGV